MRAGGRGRSGAAGTVPCPRDAVAVVDDEPLVLRAVERILAPCGHPLRCASSLDALDARLDDPRLAVVLLDLFVGAESGLAGEGKTYTAINMAISIATEHDTSVVLVDCDLAQPKLMSRLGLPEARGLTELLLDPQLPLDEVVLGTNIPRLSLLPAGGHRKGTSEMLTSDAMTQRLRELEGDKSRQIVVFDSPPLLWSLLDPRGAEARWADVRFVDADPSPAGCYTTTIVEVDGERVALRDGLLHSH